MEAPKPKDETVKKQRRASKPKVKTGCNNCKNRRVKCDETRPQCLKCVRSGRQCEGYPAYKRTLESAIPIAPRPENPSGSSISSASGSSASSGSPPAARHPVRKHRVIQVPRARVKKRQVVIPDNPVVKYISPRQTPELPSPTLYRPGGFAFDSQEGQYFQVFRTHTASELSGFFDSEFWQRSVLQESHSEASIRHAVVALGALYKTLEKASESPPGSPDNGNFDTAPKHYNFALQQYGKALTRLRESLENRETRSERTILISIVLFTCFQSFTGDHKAAISQIQHGLGLLEERRHDSKQPLIRRKDDVVEDELVQMFTRLAIQAKSYDMAFHFPHPYVIRLTPQTRQDPTSPQSQSSPSDTSSTSIDPNIPEMFLSSQEARTALDSICERIMRFQELLSSYHHGPNNILPKSVQSLGMGFGMQLKQWGSAFAPLLESRRNRAVTITERAGIDVLKMLHLMTGILYQMGFSTSEKDFDKFYPLFKEIVELAKEVVVDEELSLAQKRCGSITSCRHRQNPGYDFPGLAAHQPGTYREEEDYSHIKASFALDLGIVPPLFVVATKCRDRKLRREAIRLLMSSPRREGMWDSILSGRVGSWIMHIEEAGLTPWDGRGAGMGEVVPDERRVMVKEILFDMQSREATLRCGTRGARDSDWDDRARETHISW
ncbi:hypothetical protein ONS95_008746 [Cadophora gregata]|uniref:uncharacterized protein n=1 Tax=Cadophora gregata TaxID=51156 RepID=UPI0026DC8F8B|nr:uncharacterized protein ONS95_008746 [Cadophora gregata]KAK0123739.1 hypothetical protein ONS95_008746 [Cadophora gregata]